MSENAVEGELEWTLNHTDEELQYLTDGPKAELNAKIDRIAEGDGEHMELDLDPKITPFIKKLNRLDGFATTGSCQGHPRSAERGHRQGYVFVCHREAIPVTDLLASWNLYAPVRQGGRKVTNGITDVSYRFYNPLEGLFDGTYPTIEFRFYGASWCDQALYRAEKAIYQFLSELDERYHDEY